MRSGERLSHALTPTVAFSIANTATVAFTAAVSGASCQRRSAYIQQRRSRWRSYRVHRERGRRCVRRPLGGVEYFQRRRCALLEAGKERRRRANLYDWCIQWLRISTEVVELIFWRAGRLPLAALCCAPCIHSIRYILGRLPVDLRIIGQQFRIDARAAARRAVHRGYELGMTIESENHGAFMRVSMTSLQL